MTDPNAQAMTEPKKLTREALDYIRGLIDEVRSYVYVPDLLGHIDALDLEAVDKDLEIGKTRAQRDEAIALVETVDADHREMINAWHAAIARAEAAEARIAALKRGLDITEQEWRIADAHARRTHEAEARVKVLEAERDEWRKRCVDAEVHRARAALSSAKEPI